MSKNIYIFIFCRCFQSFFSWFFVDVLYNDIVVVLVDNYSIVVDTNDIVVDHDVVASDVVVDYYVVVDYDVVVAYDVVASVVVDYDVARLDESIVNNEENVFEGIYFNTHCICDLGKQSLQQLIEIVLIR